MQYTAVPSVHATCSCEPERKRQAFMWMPADWYSCDLLEYRDSNACDHKAVVHVKPEMCISDIVEQRVCP